MSIDWSGLRELGLTVEPIIAWPGPATPDSARVASPFKGTVRELDGEGRAVRYRQRKTPFATTIKDLRRELDMLNARNPLLQLALSARDVRRDGFPRADARLAHPGIVLRVHAMAVRGQPELIYAVDSFPTWQDNLRAAAKGMEAQRMLKRYGIAQMDQQYTGYRALPSPSQQTPEEARTLLVRYTVDHVAARRLDDKALFRTAAKGAQGADDSEGAMNAVMNAARTLGVVT